jgi:hypothetical protein
MEKKYGSHTHFVCNNCLIEGNHNTIDGNNNVVWGNHNRVTGKGNKLTGNHNNVTGDSNSVNGNHNKFVGNNNTGKGNYNYFFAKGQQPSSWSLVPNLQNTLTPSFIPNQDWENATTTSTAFSIGGFGNTFTNSVANFGGITNFGINQNRTHHTQIASINSGISQIVSNAVNQIPCLETTPSNPDIDLAKESKYSDPADPDCKICLTRKNQCILSCEHSLCVPCWKAVVKSNKEQNKAPTCPFCRETISAQPKLLASLFE